MVSCLLLISSLLFLITFQGHAIFDNWVFLFPQALQALQRQPNAAQYFHQFMLQQQLNSAQLHSLAAVQQVSCQGSKGLFSEEDPDILPSYSNLCTGVILIHGETMGP